MKKDIRIFLMLELAAVIVALLSFRLIEVRWQAGMVAGFCFVAAGLYIVLKTLRWPGRFRFFTFYFSRVYLWLFALPMVLVRWRFLGQDFDKVHLFSISGPTFHRWSEVSFLLLVVATGLDLARVMTQERRAAQ
jgi:hypothetical protein